MKSKTILVTASAIVTPVLASTLLLIGCAKSSEESEQTESQRSPKTEDVTRTTPNTSAGAVAPQTIPKTEALAQITPDNTPRAVVGESAPEFKLIDQWGKLVTLSELRSDSNVALVFYRSAVW